MIVAAYARRYEPQWLVDDLRENLSWVDGFAELDDRDRAEPWSNTAERVKRLFAIVREMGADTVFYTAPDERLQDGAGEVLRALAPGRYSLNLRELWTPDSYRVDGTWGGRRRKRFYTLDDDSPVIPLNIDIYHLKMIEPENRAERARVHAAHNTWDNRRRGFSYMTDETGLVLERIPQGRGYSPPYRPYRFEVPS